jgi:hypothetical protein
MEIHEPHGRRFQVALELLREGNSFTFDGVRFSLSDELLVVAIESSFWPHLSKQTALTDIHRAMNIAGYLARESDDFASIYQSREHRFLLLNYYGHGGEMEVARMVREEVVWAMDIPPSGAV